MPYMRMTNSDTGTETEDSLQKRMSTEIQLDPGHLPSDVHLENERLPLCAEFIMESKDFIEKEETKIKQEPCLLEETTSELKTELEVIHGSDILIKTEPASDLTIPSDPHIHRDHEIDTKIEIKEEPVYWEMAHEERSQPKEINHEDVDLHLDTQVQIQKTGGENSTGTFAAVSDKVISLVSDQVTSLSNETDSDAAFHNNTPFISLGTIVLPVTEATVLVDVVDASTATGNQLSKIQETPKHHKYGNRRQKRTLNEVYEQAQDMAASQVKKNKKKIIQMCSISDMKLKIRETDLKIMEEELAARRRRGESEEEESKLRKAILKVEQEIAKAKFDKKSGLV